MAKFVFFVVFLAALVAVSVAQGETAAQRFRDMQCRREVQENPLDACRQVVDRQLTGRARIVSIPFQVGVRMRCCQQLQDISRECRCAAIRRMVRDYEQTMAPLEEGYPGETAEQKQEQGFYGETAEQQRQQQQQQQQQKGEGLYGETAERQQEVEGFYGEETVGRQQEELYGESTQQQQEGEGFYGQTEQQQQQGEGRCRQTAEWSRKGQENYCGRRTVILGGQKAAEEEFGETSERPQRGSVRFPPCVGTEQQITRVRRTKVRQYVARLPTMCQIEPQECSVFFAGQY